MLIRIGCGTFSKGMIGQIYQEYLFCAESVPVPVKEDDAITFLNFEKERRGIPHLVLSYLLAKYPILTNLAG